MSAFRNRLSTVGEGGTPAPRPQSFRRISSGLGCTRGPFTLSEEPHNENHFIEPGGFKKVKELPVLVNTMDYLLKIL